MKIVYIYKGIKLPQRGQPKSIRFVTISTIRQLPQKGADVLVPLKHARWFMLRLIAGGFKDCWEVLMAPNNARSESFEVFLTDPTLRYCSAIRLPVIASTEWWNQLRNAIWPESVRTKDYRL